jgi:Tfp pilus assembly protein PilZ
VETAHESRLQKFYSRNISRGGIFLEMHEVIPVGKELHLIFNIPGRNQPLEVAARVVRHHQMSSMDENFNPTAVQGVGLSFVNLSEEDRHIIEQFITGKGLAIQG